MRERTSICEPMKQKKKRWLKMNKLFSRLNQSENKRREGKRIQDMQDMESTHAQEWNENKEREN